MKLLGAEEFILFYALGVKHIDSAKNMLKQLAEPELLRQLKLLEDQGINVKLEITPGLPSEEINKYAYNKDVSLIVIGTHGESMAQHLLFKLGSVANEILHSHKKPLLIVRTKISELNGEKIAEVVCADFRESILFPTDFSENSYRAFTYLEKIAETGTKKITLLHVQDKTKIDKHLNDKLEDFNKIDKERLEMRRKSLIEKGAKEVETKIIYGVPKKEILAEAKKGYTLILMGSQGKGYIEELFVGSVSHSVVRNADISVLLIPALR